MIAAISQSGCRSVGVVRFASVSDDFGVKKEVIVLIRHIISRLAIESLGDQSKWLELAKYGKFAKSRRHLVSGTVNESAQREREIPIEMRSDILLAPALFSSS